MVDRYLGFILWSSSPGPYFFSVNLKEKMQDLLICCYDFRMTPMPCDLCTSIQGKFLFFGKLTGVRTC